MTIIAAIQQAEGPTLLGCNSRGLVGGTILSADRSKWIRVGEWAISLTGRGLMNDVVAAAVHDFPLTDNPIEFMTHLRGIFRAANVGELENGSYTYNTTGLLVRREGPVYDIDPRFCVAPLNRGDLWARGSGMNFALGASFVLPEDSPPRARLRRALDAAIALDSGCPGIPLIEEF